MGIFKKKTKLEKFYNKNEEFIKYCVVSTVCTGILYLVFFIVDYITNGNYLIANFLSYTISFAILFIFMVFLSNVIFKESFSIKNVIYYLVLLIFSILGGIIGKNMKEEIDA